MINIKVDSGDMSGDVEISLKGGIKDLAFELAMICSSVINSIEEDSDKEIGDELRKGLARYLITSVRDGDPLKEVKSQAVAIDGNAYEFLKRYAEDKKSGRFD